MLLVKYTPKLKPCNNHSERIAKAEKDFAKKFDFKYITFTVKIRDIHKIEKKKSIGISLFGYEK